MLTLIEALEALGVNARVKPVYEGLVYVTMDNQGWLGNFWWEKQKRKSAHNYCQRLR